MQDEVTGLLSAHTLEELTFPKGKGRQALDKVADAKARLQQLAGSDGPADLRFKASEVLLALGSSVPETGRARRAADYAQALADAPTHNAWGLPADVMSSPTSRHLIQLGPEAVAALRPLLDDQRPLRYIGSEEPTVSKMCKYRVADLAAALLAQILRVPFRADAEDPAARDLEIATLKTRLSPAPAR